jgi:adenylylsulfate kinase
MNKPQLIETGEHLKLRLNDIELDNGADENRNVEKTERSLLMSTGLSAQLPISTNVVWHHATVTRARREALNGHRGAILWFTGLSGSGKSTLAHAVEETLHHRGCRTFVLDGDNVRHGLCGDLGFSAQDRQENIRRIGEMAKIFMDAGIIVLTAFISPYCADRERVRGIVEHGDFIEIYCDTPIEICELRDVKGLYKKARAGQLEEFTGITSPYEAPENCELTVYTGTVELDACVQQVIDKMIQRGIISTSNSNY